MNSINNNHNKYVNNNIIDKNYIRNNIKNNVRLRKYSNN